MRIWTRLLIRCILKAYIYIVYEQYYAERFCKSGFHDLRTIRVRDNIQTVHSDSERIWQKEFVGMGNENPNLSMCSIS